jgi:membrane fusion protein, copper/silver efflux system
MRRSFTKWTVLIALSILIAGGGAWLAMRILSPRAGPAQPETGQRNVLYYRSTMMLGEISQTPRKDSMGMEMVPVFEGEEDTAIKVDPVTTQNMGLRTAHFTRGPVHRSIRTVGRN